MTIVPKAYRHFIGLAAAQLLQSHLDYNSGIAFPESDILYITQNAKSSPVLASTVHEGLDLDRVRCDLRRMQPVPRL